MDDYNQEEIEEEIEKPLVDDTENQKYKAEQRIVLPGDYIGESLIAGHGTYEN
jgi:hypothetical protein